MTALAISAAWLAAGAAVAGFLNHTGLVPDDQTERRSTLAVVVLSGPVLPVLFIGAAIRERFR